MTLLDRLNLIAEVSASLSVRGNEARNGNAETVFMIATLPDDVLDWLLKHGQGKIPDPDAMQEMNARKDSLLEALKPCPVCGLERKLGMQMVDGRPRVFGACLTLGHN